MRSVALLTGRNLRLYFRDRTGVFFSLLSALILVLLYVFFLGGLQAADLEEEWPKASSADIDWFVNTWVFAGVTMVTTLTTSLAAMNVFVDDRASGRFSDFIVSPIKRWQIILGYLSAAFIVALVMTLFVTVIGQVYLVARGGELMSVGQAVSLVGFIALSCAAFAALSSFIVTFLKTTGSFGALSTLVGTLVGFLAGAYLPTGILPTGVVNVVNSLPFGQSAMLIRGPFTEDSLAAVSGGQPEAVDAVGRFYGITAYVGDTQVTTAMACAVLVGVTVLFAALGTWRLARTIA